jgi:tRNA pseudouridine32 synthase / 23S rRNA pseudouridine746 synthase
MTTVSMAVLLITLLLMRPVEAAFAALASPSMFTAGGDGQQPTSTAAVHPTIQILFESDHILAINKPTGIPHHDDGEEPGILSVVRQQQASSAIHYQGRLYGVHRLDRVTSGILLFAKDQETAATLTKAFRDGTVTKYYTGLSAKKPTSKKQGWVKGNMVRGRRKSWYLTRDLQGENYAVTRYFTAGLAGLAGSNVDQEDPPPKTLLLFRPMTGKTHQLRVAAKSVGLPLQGDPVYTDGEDRSGSRTYLHATGLHVDLETEHSITVWSQPPFGHLWTGGFDQALDRLVEKHCTDCNPLLELASLTKQQRGSQ